MMLWRVTQEVDHIFSPTSHGVPSDNAFHNPLYHLRLNTNQRQSNSANPAIRPTWRLRSSRGSTKSRPTDRDLVDLAGNRQIPANQLGSNEFVRDLADLSEEQPEVGWVLSDLVVGKEVCWGHFRL